MEVVQNSGIGDAFYMTNPGGVPLLIEPRSMYVLNHLLGQKLNMCSHRFIALGRDRTISLLLLIVFTDFIFFLFACPTAVLVRTPTDWTNSRTFILVLV